MLLQDKVAVVTGGTRGIGYAVVKKYLENGAKVVLFGSKEESVDKAIQSLKEENPDWVVEGMWPNLTDANEMADAIAKVGEKYGRLDILVNNAGISQSTKLEDYQPEDFAGICCFLATDAASYINGAIIPVDGAWDIGVTRDF